MRPQRSMRAWVAVAALLAVAGCSRPAEPVPTPAPSGAVGSTPAISSAFGGFGTFEAFTKRDNGDGRIVLPTTATAGVVTFTSQGSGPFIVRQRDTGRANLGEPLVEVHGRYGGQVAYGLEHLGSVASLRITASGPWTARIEPIADARALTGATSGTGDTVLRYDGPAARLAVAQSEGTRLVVTQFDAAGSRTLLTASAPVEATVDVAAGPSILTVRADGAWRIG